MIAITFTVKLLEPALLTLLEGEPNSARSADFIPGSAIRGAFLSNLATASESDLAVIERRFFDGSIRFLNAYPLLDGEGRDWERALPIPRSLRENKYGKDNTVRSEFLRDEAAGDLPEMEANQYAQWQTKTGFAYWRQNNQQGNTPALAPVEVTRRISIHTARGENRRKGRASSDAGAVFRYDALEAGQKFEGVVLCDNDNDSCFVKERLANIHFLGKARTGGYGRVEILPNDVPEVVSEESSEGTANVWQESPLPLPVPTKDLLVVLLSDALIRDRQTGQWAISAEALSEALLPGLTCERAFLNAQVVGGFNRKWGLPLPQVQAVARGSALKIAGGALSEDDLKRLEREGIGERREDGYGRLTFIPLHETWQLEQVDAGEQGDAPDVVAMPDSPDASLLQERIAVNRRERWLRSSVGIPATAMKPFELTVSQIARLRSALRKEILKNDPSVTCIQTFLNDLRPTARRQFERARISDQSLFKWLTDTVATPPNSPAFPSFGSNEYAEKEVEKTRWTLRYLDAVLARLAKQGGKK